MKIQRFIKLLIASFIAIPQISCSQVRETSFEIMLDNLLSESVDQIQVETLDSLIKSGDILLLDAREQIEFSTSHIKGAVCVGYENFNKAELKNFPKDKPTIVYCSVGYRSEKIGEKLEKMGFRNVKNLRGGIFEWKNSGKKVVDENGRITEKVHTYNADWSRWMWNGEKVYEK